MLHAGIPSPWPVVAGGMASHHPHHPVVPMGAPADLLLHQAPRGPAGPNSEHQHQVAVPTPSYSSATLMGHLTTGSAGYPPLGPPPPDNRYHLQPHLHHPTPHHHPHQHSQLVAPPGFYNGNYAASTPTTANGGGLIGGHVPPHHAGVVRSLSRQSQEGAGARHLSGSSQTSSHSATPPSPDEHRNNLLQYQHNHPGVSDRGSRASFDQGQCNNNTNNNTRDTTGIQQPSTPVSGLHPGSSPRAGGPTQRMPPSPATTAGQKSAFDLTGANGNNNGNNNNNAVTVGGSCSGGGTNNTTSLFMAASGAGPGGGANTAARRDSAMSSSSPSVANSQQSPLNPAVSMNSSPSTGLPNATAYHSTSVKQEPGSPATYPPRVPSIVKQEPKNPHSPGNFSPHTSTASTSSPTSSSASIPSRYPVITSRSGGSSFTYPSPSTGAGAGQTNSQSALATNPISPAGDFNRYQHNSGGGGGGGKPSPGESQCNSAISSREGTPGPKLWGADDLSGPAPNVDISKVKEEIPGSLYETNEYNQRAKVNLSYPAPTTPAPRSTESYMSPYHHLPPQVSVPSRCGQPTPGVPAVATGLLGGDQVVGGGTGPRAYRSNVGRPPMVGAGPPGNSDGSVSHSNVKIGRRPAHLPKVLKFEDHTLPHGWQRKLKQRKHGKQAGRWDVYIYSPCGVKFASRKKLKHFFEKNNLQYDAEQFDFTPYGKHIDNNSSARHLSSASSGSNRHSGSPGGVSSPPSTGYPSGCQSNPGSDIMLPLGPGGQTGGGPTSAHHNTYMPPNHATQYGFDPMMESPPNANARELPHNHILNLSQNPAAVGVAAVVSHHPRIGHHPHHRPPGPAFPTEMDTLLNDSLGVYGASQPRTPGGGLVRDYGATTDSTVREEEHDEVTRRGDDSERGGFMATSMNILSEGNMDINNEFYSSMYTTP